VRIASPILPSADRRGVQHICIEASRLNDVGRAYDLAQERDLPIILSLGRHTMDTLVSFCIRTPSGFDIEFGAGGELLNDGHRLTLAPTASSALRTVAPVRFPFPRRSPAGSTAVEASTGRAASRLMTALLLGLAPGAAQLESRALVVV
jgi:hypothetical protein